MSQVPPTITNASLSLVLGLNDVNPSPAGAKLNIPLTYAGLTFLKRATGVYTPNNDTLSAFNFDSSDYQPTFFMFRCDLPTLLYITDGSGTPMMEMTVNKLVVLHLAPIVTHWGAVQLIGQSAGGAIQTPMAQNVPVNWSIYLSDGSVS